MKKSIDTKIRECCCFPEMTYKHRTHYNIWYEIEIIPYLGGILHDELNSNT